MINHAHSDYVSAGLHKFARHSVFTGRGPEAGSLDAADAVAMLRELRGREHRVVTGVALVDAATHRDLLDAFGGLKTESAHVASLYRSWKSAEKALADHRARVEETAREAADGELTHIASSSFLSDIAAMKHETQRSRIFRT